MLRRRNGATIDTRQLQQVPMMALTALLVIGLISSVMMFHEVGVASTNQKATVDLIESNSVHIVTGHGVPGSGQLLPPNAQTISPGSGSATVVKPPVAPVVSTQPSQPPQVVIPPASGSNADVHDPELKAKIIERIRGRHLTAEQVAGAAQVLVNYVHTCRKILNAKDTSVPKKYVYYGIGKWTAGRHDFSFGNKFMAVLSNFALGLATNRCLTVQIHGSRPGIDYMIHDLFEDPFFDWSLVRQAADKTSSLYQNPAPVNPKCWKSQGGDGTCYKFSITIRFKDGRKKPTREMDRIWQTEDLDVTYKDYKAVQIDAFTFYGPWLFSNPHYHAKFKPFEVDFSGILSRFLFKPAPKLQGYIDQFRAQHFRDYTLTIHLRDQASIAGVALKRPPTKGLQCAEKIFKQGLAKVQKTNPQAVGRVFVAAQHPSALKFVHQTFDKYGKNTVLTVDMHKLSGIPAGSEESKKKLFHAMHALTDMFLLGSGDDLIQSMTSTFSCFAYGWGGVTPWTGACGVHPNSQMMELCFQYNRKYCGQWANKFQWLEPKIFPVSVYACPKWPNWRPESMC